MKINSRKLLLAIGVLVTATVALFINMATFESWSSFVQWTLGIYMVGNVADKSKLIQEGKDATTK